jgi:peptidoglycan/xylan/chitin deacetylase (PgdA/CDA1 family)
MAEHRALHPELWRGLSWAEVRQVRDAGVSLGYHSHFHESYGHLTDVATRADIDRGLSYWRREIGTSPTAFAFPKGGYGTYPDTAVGMLRASGLSTLFSTYLGRTELPAPEAILGRLVILQHDDLDIFRQKVFGAFDWLGRPRELDQAMRKSLGR